MLLFTYLFIVDNKKGLDVFLFILNIYYNKDISYLKAIGLIWSHNGAINDVRV